MSTNPYAAPRAAVGDVEAEEEYQEIRMWSPSGRIGRLRYLAYTIGASLLLGAGVGLLAAVIDSSIGMVVVVLLYIVFVVFSFITAIKRSHDMDWTGWTVLLTLIPLVGLIWLFNPGTRGPNRYGAPPPPNTTGVKVLACLLPVVFIVGILAAIAIPAYHDYQQRAQEYQQSE